MKYSDISESFIKQIILEAENKNTHLEHLEDNIFNKGFQGAKEAVNYLYSLHEMLEGNSQTPISMTTKTISTEIISIDLFPCLCTY